MKKIIFGILLLTAIVFGWRYFNKKNIIKYILANSDSLGVYTEETLNAMSMAQLKTIQNNPKSTTA